MPGGLAFEEASLGDGTAGFPFCRPVSVPLNTAGFPMHHASATMVTL